MYVLVIYKNQVSRYVLLGGCHSDVYQSSFTLCVTVVKTIVTIFFASHYITNIA